MLDPSTFHPLLGETVLTFRDAAEQLPAVGGRKVSVKTVYHWADMGVKVAGRVVKLESIKFGGRRVTSAEAFARFFEATSAGPPALPPIRSPAARKESSEAAGKWVLEKIRQANRERRD